MKNKQLNKSVSEIFGGELDVTGEKTNLIDMMEVVLRKVVARFNMKKHHQF